MEKSKMEKALEEFLNRKFKSKDVTETASIIKSMYTYCCYQEHVHEVVISFINKLINTTEFRVDGFKLLNSLFYKIPVNIVIDNYVLWFSMSISINYPEEFNYVKLRLIFKLIQTCSKNQEFDKFIHGQIQKLLNIHLSVESNPKLICRSLDLITLCIENYPNSSKSTKTKLEQKLIKFISTKQPDNVMKKVGHLFHLLQQIDGEVLTNRRTNWTNQLYRLCKTMHKVYDILLQNVTEYVDVIYVDVEPLEIPCLEDSGYDSIENQNQRALVLKNLIVIIECMLIEKYPYAKNMSPPLVLNVLKRGLMVDVYGTCDSIEEVQFNLLMSDHQICLLALLRSFIACCGRILVSYCTTISKIIIDCMQRTQKQHFQTDYKYSEAVHKTLRHWVATVQGSFDTALHNKVVSIILSEIAPTVNNVALNLNKDLPKTLTRKTRRKGTTNIAATESSTANSRHSRDFSIVKENRCMQALKTSTTFLENVELDLDKNNFVGLFKTVSDNILVTQANKAVLPYLNQNCVDLLYKTLLGFFHQEKYCVKPFINIAQNIFKNLSRVQCSQNGIKISNDFQNSLEKLCQPICGNLSIPIDFKELSLVGQGASEERSPLFAVPPETEKSNLSTDTVTDSKVSASNSNEEEKKLPSEVEDQQNTDSSNDTKSDKVEDLKTTEEPPTQLPEPTLPDTEDHDPAISLESTSKINVLDHTVIKPPQSTTNGSNLGKTSSALSANKNSEKSAIGKSEKKTARIVFNSEKRKEGPSYRIVFDTDEEPQVKQIKIEANDDEEKRMLDSFKDTIN